MSATLYNVGDVAVVTILVRDEAGALADPTTLAAVFAPEVGARVSFAWPASITRTALGTFRLEVPITEGGYWRGDVTATGAITPAAQPHVLYARKA